MSDAPLDTRPVADIPLRPDFGWRWRAAIAASVLATLLLAYATAQLVLVGVGVWGTNIPYVWGFDLINYVWWIGIANAASLVAAVLVLRNHGLRTAANRFAEAAALAAVLCAALYPILHIGRPWLFYWVFPYPAATQVWPQFRSPLVWDLWGIMSHVVVTSLFWYIGLIPDLATLRDRARVPWVARFYGVVSLGWRNSVRHWARHQAAYRLAAGLVLPLLVIAQSAVALEFATLIVPGWHEARLTLHLLVTGLPSGMGIVLALAVLLRWSLRLERFIDERDMTLLCLLLAAAAVAAGMVYADGALFLVQQEDTTRAAMLARITGHYAPAYWGAVALTALLPQLLWSARVRSRGWAVLAIGLGASAGVWLDRVSIVVGGLQRDFLDLGRPLYAPTGQEWVLLLGTLGLFALVLLVVARTVPVVSMYETRHEESEAEREEEQR